MKKSTHMTSISAWAKTLKGTAHRSFARQITQEEQAKIGRLDHLEVTRGLPIYPTRRFLLPNQVDAYEAFCKKVTASRVWDLALRFSEPAGNTAIHRMLGATYNDAIATGKRLARIRPCSANVTPYREPDYSGTFMARPGVAFLEYVRGPHFWITKRDKAAGKLQSCELRFPQVSVTYSTDHPNERAFLFRRFQYCVQNLMGCTIGELRNQEQFVYAEFHWHEGLGPKFIECSFSEAWAGTAARFRENDVEDERVRR